MDTNRRRFLKTSLASSTLVAMGATTVPGFLGRSARAAGAGKPNERILVVVQLLGGNDGLNTVVPHGIDGYNRGRRTLRIGSSQVHKVTAEIGLHPAMGGMSKLLEKGRLNIVQGVGYPNPDRSHFRSMEIWEAARLENDAKALETGWLGRGHRSEGRKPGEDPPALHVGRRSLPQALRSLKTEVPALESLESYKLQLTGSEPERKAERSALNEMAIVERKRDDPLLGFIRQTTLSAYESSSRLEQVAPKAGGMKYPNFGLAHRLELVAQMIKAGFGTRIFYTSLDGFDTHANQLGTHAGTADRALGFDRGVPRRPLGRRPGRPRGRADLQRVRPPGRGERVARDRSRRGRAGVPRRVRWRSPDWSAPTRSSTTWTTAT